MWRTAVTMARGALPAVLVATLIPLALFYAVLAVGSVMWAVGVSVVYAYGLAACQHFRNRRVSGMLVVTVFMATLRIATTVATGHADVYFAIPVVETAGFGLMFLATMFSREPLVVRLARDLVPLAADGLAERRSLVRILSVIWTVTYVGSGLTTLLLLVTVPLPVFLGAHTVTGWVWSGSGAVGSVLVCRARARGLFTVIAAGGKRPAGAETAVTVSGAGGTPALAA